MGNFHPNCCDRNGVLWDFDCGIIHQAHSWGEALPHPVLILTDRRAVVEGNWKDRFWRKDTNKEYTDADRQCGPTPWQECRRVFGIQPARLIPRPVLGQGV